MMATWTCGRMTWIVCATIADCRVCETTTLGEKWKMERDVDCCECCCCCSCFLVSLRLASLVFEEDQG